MATPYLTRSTGIVKAHFEGRPDWKCSMTDRRRRHCPADIRRIGDPAAWAGTSQVPRCRSCMLQHDGQHLLTAVACDQVRYTGPSGAICSQRQCIPVTACSGLSSILRSTQARGFPHPPDNHIIADIYSQARLRRTTLDFQLLLRSKLARTSLRSHIVRVPAVISAHSRLVCDDPALDSPVLAFSYFPSFLQRAWLALSYILFQTKSIQYFANGEGHTFWTLATRFSNLHL